LGLVSSSTTDVSRAEYLSVERVVRVIVPREASSLPLEYGPVPADQVVSGSPTTGIAELGEFDGHAFGVWEMTPGAMSDTEDDEFFVVLFGAATVEFVDEGRTVSLVAGSIMTLTAGARTVWTVMETLRKVWVA
jgi:uncharacterized cupin superfamily protein